uniref:G_PROTEIN_RECEP_F1_2 domain-containing protein n=1 Tax=Caenorhabditis tropicalis TaxID=1561998 RepID=A0A1I7TN77_9PELO
MPDAYRDFLTIFYPLFFTLTILTQAILLYLIFYHSPRSLKTMKVFLGNTCFFQVLLVVVTCASQFRMISTSVPIELRSYGPCRYFEAWVGYSLYQMLQGLTIQAFLPLVFYLPVFILYFICILTHSEILFQQYFMTVVPALPALVDPFVTLYFVTPYRRRLKIWMRIEKESKVMPVITSQIN